MNQARWIGGAATLAGALFAVLAVLSLGWLQPEGLGNFDGRLLGYGLAEADAYLAVLPDRARALYLGLFRLLDTIFPVLLAVAIGAATWRHAVGLTPARRSAIMGMIGAYLMMDLAENAYVAQILCSGGPLAAGLVDRASDMTRLKWLFLGLSLAVLVGAWWRNRRVSP